MSLSHRCSRHSVSDLRQSARFTLFTRIFRQQHQWTPKPSTEMASCPHHLCIRAVDRILDIFHRLRLYIPRLVEQRYHGVLRQGRRCRLLYH
jgi:hypothetical protein